jgi:flagellar biosynthesis/type III secretory pathway chaperone
LPANFHEEILSESVAQKKTEDSEYSDNHIDDLMGNLLEILYNELSQYRILIDMLIEQRKCFSERSIEVFEEIIKKQGTTILKIKTLEEARKSVVSQLSQFLGISQEDITLSKLADLVSEPYSRHLSTFCDEINSIISDLENIKESNSYLIQHALHYVSGVLKIFASSHSQNVKYSNNGQLEQGQGKGKFVSSWG